jgi:hypothetical protein
MFCEFVRPADAVLRRGRTLYALVAERGSALLLSSQHQHASSECYLDPYTNEQCRGGGICLALIAVAYEAAQRARSTRVNWRTDDGNRPATLLYDKMADDYNFTVCRKNIT